MKMDNIDNNKTINEKILFNSKEITLSLTGKDSHKVLIEDGQGSFSIGTNNSDEKNFDVLVDENDMINWDTFNGYYTLAGWESKEYYPYGNWPRCFCYHGNDVGFIKWSSKREIEHFILVPQKDMNLDLTNTGIYDLIIEDNGHKIELSLGKDIYRLKLCGNIDNYIINKCAKVPVLSFEIKEKENVKCYKLPIIKSFWEATEINIEISSLSSPFDCSSLLQFPNLKKLFLIGNVTNLESLKELKNIEKLGIWSAPNLSGMPKLNNWNNLNWFVANNIDENAGKIFRREILDLKKIKSFEFSSVTNLRDKLWFQTNYGIPFSEWNGLNERKATRAYKICLDKVKKSNTKEDLKKAIINFTDIFNKMENIETTERDDVYIALCTIMKNTSIEINAKEWESWFDERREF